MLARKGARITFRLQSGKFFDGYTWSVLHGKETGELSRAEVDDRTTYEAEGFPAGQDPQSTPTVGHCSDLARGDPDHGSTHFENSGIYLSPRFIEPYLEAVPVEERIHNTYDYSECDTITTLIPPQGPVRDETRSYLLPLP